jgi:hypothetical protein
MGMVLALASYGRAQTISADDEAAIKKPAVNYIEGWYAADAARMESAVHPELAKRIVGTNPQGTSSFGSQGAMTLVQSTRNGGGRNTPKENQRSEISILDRYDNMAVVKVVSFNYVDYLQVAKWNGEWKIINVLWEPNLSNQ